MTLLPTSDLLAGYEPIAGHHDELFDGSEVRPQWRAVADSLLRLGRGELSQRTMALRRLLVDDGVSYNVISGERSAVRSWTLDPVPMVVPAEEWAGLEAGLVQRSELLDRLLADLYGPRRLIADGTIPPEVVYGHPGFLRACDGTQLPGRHQLIHAAYDVGRAPDGTWTLISDRTQAPSGVGYARENRVALSRVMPDLYRDLDVVRLAPFFLNLRAALERVAPASADAPRIVVLTPGPRSETAFEHGSLASYLGYPLVQGADLRVRDGRVWVRTLGRLEPVHVILRRVDAAWCDPLELLPDSTLGAPGLLEACRVGNVSVVNALGSGALENPGLMPFLADACRALLGEDLRLPSVTTWWCGDEGSRRHVAANLDRLVLKSLSATGTRTV
ncbi:MAG: circularly permuted type 2 ATP-grasp protein [Myxococcales bacterium]|nr:circularly permuted type 2 ATP-grasp protein [Myxococcales bacterium]